MNPPVDIICILLETPFSFWKEADKNDLIQTRNIKVLMDSSDDVVISGVGGRFPQCDNFEELEAKLFGRVNMVNNDKPRWQVDELNYINAIGKIKDPDVFDYTFFGIYSKLCEVMANNTRLMMTTTVEALCDAGMNIKDVSGTNTAVVTTSGLCEAEYVFTSGQYIVNQGLLGMSKCMEANRISYFLNTKGPSYVINASWNGGLLALQKASEMIKNGEVDTAIVGAASSTIVRGEMSYHYDKMGRLDKDGITRSFSDDASGYARSEAVVVFVLQKACQAKRSYGSVLGTICESGYSMKTSLYTTNPTIGIEMINSLHEETGIKPSEVAYIEGYGGASKKLDAIELNTYADFYLRESRQTPLLVGSVMSNLGHCEFASSLVSLAKALISLKTGVIPPNLHYSSPNSLVPALKENKLKIVTEPTPLKGEIIGLGSYSSTGDFGFALFRRNPKMKRDTEMKRADLSIPRLITLSGRTESAFEEVLNKVVAMPIDDEFIRLVNEVFKKRYPNYLYRGYAIVDGTPKSRTSIEAYEGIDKPVWFLFSGMGSQWCGMGKELLKIDLFAKAIQKCDAVLRPKGLDIFDILTTEDPKIFDNILHSFVGIAAVQIGLVDILRALGVQPDGIVGHSVGELGCAYADGCFSAEQMILSAYARGKASIEVELIKGMMAAVGKGYNDIKDELPPTIKVACHNSSTSCTLSGPAEDMTIYIAKLKAAKVFAKLVNVSNIAYHSQCIKPAAPALLKYLQQTIPSPKQRTSRWVSSSIPEANWTTPLAKYSSAEYHTNNLLSPVLFEEASRHIPEKAIVIEIAPHGLMQSIVKRSLPTCNHVPLTNRFDSDGVRMLFGAIGKLYTAGIDVDVSCLYPKIEFPVSRETPYLHPLVTWDNSTRFVIQYDKALRIYTKSSKNFKSIQVQTTDNYWTSRKRCMHTKREIPLAYYLEAVLDFYDLKTDSKSRLFTITNIRNEKIKETRDELKLDFEIALLRGSGKFEVTDERSERIVSGNVGHNALEQTKPLDANILQSLGNGLLTIEKNEVYDFFKYHGYVLDESLHLIQHLKISDSGVEATIKWNDSLTDFMETAFSVITFYHSFKNNALHVVTFIGEISIDKKYFNGESKDLSVSYDATTNVLSTQGFTIRNIQTEKTKNMPKVDEFITQPAFVPYSNANFSTIHDMLNAFTNVVQENISDIVSTEGVSTSLNVINLHSDPVIKVEIEKLINFSNKLRIRLFNCPSDGAQCLESNIFGNDTVGIVVDESSVKAAISALEDGNCHFVLTNYTDDITKNSSVTVVSDWVCQKKRFVVLKQHTTTEDELKIVHATKVNWKIDLAEALTQTKDQIIHVIKPFQRLVEIYEVLNYMDNIGFPNRIRLLLVDDKTPKYTPTSPYFNDQLKKDVKVNVSLEGKWGTLVQSVCPKIKEDTSVIGFEKFPLSSITCSDVKIMSIGLPLLDVTGHMPTTILGPMEYSGIANGEPVVGLATLDKSNNLTLDNHLQWAKPKNWSHHEVSSSLLAYTIACHAVGVIDEHDGLIRKIALVHRGALPVCQAIINILNAASWQIITSYKTDEEKEKIKSLYPKFQDDQILSCNDHSFYAIVRLNHPKGIGAVVNALIDNELINYSLKCLERNGVCIHLNGGPSNARSKIGMLPFFNEVKMVGISIQEILTLRDSVKENVRNKVKEVISYGNAKPFPYEEISNSHLTNDILHILTKRKPTDSKLVVRMNTNGDKSKMFTCDKNKAYFALGETTVHALKLIEYLVSRQGKNIYACLDEKTHTDFSKKMLFSILKNRPNVQIDLVPKDRIKSISSVIQLIKNMTSSNEIGGIIMLGMYLDNTASIFDKALEETKTSTSLMSIGRGGECTHYTRHRRGESSVCVRCDLDGLFSESLNLNFDNLMALPQSPTIFELRENNPTEMTNSIVTIDTSYLPKDLDELMLYKTTRTANPCFVELESGCPTYEYTKEVDPLFLITGFRPVLIREFAKNIFYPTFEARLPAEFDSLESVAQILSEEIAKFDLNVVTLLADTCGGVLAFLTANNLEYKGKTISLILLDAAPHSTRKWVENDIRTSQDDMIKKYAKQLKVRRGTSDETSSLRDISDGVRIIRNYQNAISESYGSGKSFSGQCTYVRMKRHDDTNGYEDIVRLQEICNRSLRVEQTEEASLHRMIGNPNTISYVNKIVPYDFKDSARPLTFDDMETF